MLSPGFKVLIETAPVSRRASELNVSLPEVLAGLSKPVVSDQVYTVNIYMILLILMARQMAILGIYYTIST
jgi:hypothetical protein